MKPLNLEQLEQLSEQIREAELSVTISKLAATFDNDKYNMERQTLRHYYSEIMRFRDYCYEHDAEAVTARLSIPTPGFVLTRARQWESHPCFSALTLWKNSTYNAMGRSR